MNRFIILLASNSEAEKNMEIAHKLLTINFPENIRFSENHWSAIVLSEGHEIPQGELSRYLNMVCMAQSENSLDTIQVFLKKMELEMGRLRGVEAHGRVLIDLDLVEWNGAILRPKDADQEYYHVCLRDL